MSDKQPEILDRIVGKSSSLSLVSIKGKCEVKEHEDGVQILGYGSKEVTTDLGAGSFVASVE